MRTPLRASRASFETGECERSGNEKIGLFAPKENQFYFFAFLIRGGRAWFG
jgi:hypothetical protein